MMQVKRSGESSYPVVTKLVLEFQTEGGLSRVEPRGPGLEGQSSGRGQGDDGALCHFRDEIPKVVRGV